MGFASLHKCSCPKEACRQDIALTHNNTSISTASKYKLVMRTSIHGLINSLAFFIRLIFRVNVVFVLTSPSFYVLRGALPFCRPTLSIIYISFSSIKTYFRVGRRSTTTTTKHRRSATVQSCLLNTESWPRSFDHFSVSPGRAALPFPAGHG
jgi:hypothetical protein